MSACFDMAKAARRLVLATFGALALAACAATTYVEQAPADPVDEAAAVPNQDQARDDDVPFARIVKFHLNPDYDVPPRCVFLKALGPEIDEDLARLVEGAIERHLRVRFARVIGASERGRLEAKHGVLGAGRSAGRMLAAKAACDAYVEAWITSAEAVYVLFWAQRVLALEIVLVRAKDDTPLWSASHTARRSDGSLPLSPLSAPVALFQSTSFHHDDDVLPSMVDDLVRRLFATLPFAP